MDYLFPDNQTFLFIGCRTNLKVKKQKLIDFVEYPQLCTSENFFDSKEIYYLNIYK